MYSYETSFFKVAACYGITSLLWNSLRGLYGYVDALVSLCCATEVQFYDYGKLFVLAALSFLQFVSSQLLKLLTCRSIQSV